MKLIYCLNSLKIKGGLERVLCQRTNYMVKNFKYEVVIVTTDQDNKELAYELDKKIKIIDLNINYYKNDSKNFILKHILNIKKHFLYRKKLIKLIIKEQPNYIISFGYEDKFVIPFLKKKSFKLIREFHIGKYERMTSFKENIKNKINEILLKKYDEFIALTHEDKILRKNKKIKIISNPLVFKPKLLSNCTNKKIISVGRLEKQKGYDILIDVWNIISKRYPDWILEIYGEGKEREKLQNKINKLGLKNSFVLKGAVQNIQDKYLESSIYVMSSRYEGFGLVLIEAMACGLPVISFDCPCGPKEIIKNNEDGFIVELGNIAQMAEKIEELINDEEKRKLFGKNARKNIQRFSQEKIMNEWKKLFENL